MTLYADIRSAIVDANLVGRRIFRPDQTEKKTFPYVEITQGQTTRADIPGHELRDFDLDVYAKRNDDPLLPRQIANLFRGLRIGSAFLRVDTITVETTDNVTQTTIAVVASVPVDQS